MDLDNTSITNNNLNNSTGPNNVAGQMISASLEQQQPSQGNNILSINRNNNNNNNHNTMTASSGNSKSSYDIDVLRIIGQHLVGIGMTQTANSLLEEAGLPSLDHPLATEFQRHIMSGEFDKASSLVEELINLAIVTLQQQPQQQPLISMLQQQQQQDNNATKASLTSSLLTEVGGSSSYPTSNGHAAQTSVTARPVNTGITCNHLESIRMRSIQEMRFAIAEQKFLELMDDYQHLKALKCLRLELTPLCDDIKHVQQLVTMVMCKSNEQVRLKANWPGKGLPSRQALLEKLSQYVPPPIMMPPRRLCTLLEQAQQLQREHCILHVDQDDVKHQPSVVDLESSELTVPSTMNGCDANGSSGSANIMNDDGDNMEQTNGNCATTSSLAFLATASSSLAATTNGTTGSTTPQSLQLAPPTASMALTMAATGNAKRYTDLKEDHVCSIDKFPLATRQEIDRHDSEIWYCKWSNDGAKLATAGVGGKVKIWYLDPHQQKLIEKCTLECNNSYSVSCLSWSPNDVYLLACGSEDHPDIWVWNMHKQELHTLIAHVEGSDHNASYTTCSWHLSGEKFAASSLKGCIVIFDLDGNRISAREGVRVQCLAFPHKDPDYVLAADTLNRLKMYAIEEGETDEDEVCTESNPILSFVIDQDDKYIAINLLEQGVHLWDLKLKTLVRILPGVRQRDTTIYSSFSCPSAPFLASGSEDGNVYIYHIRREQPVAILSGHTRGVNCVSWNPKYPELLVSVSDDRIIRLWAPCRCSMAFMTTTASIISSSQIGQSISLISNNSIQCVGELNNT